MRTKNVNHTASGGETEPNSRQDSSIDPIWQDPGQEIRPNMVDKTGGLNQSGLESDSRKENLTRFYIYYLRRPDKEDPEDSNLACPFYVGKGQNHRYECHRKEAQQLLHKSGRKIYKIAIIHALWKSGLDFTEEIFLDNLSEQDAFDIERAAIELYGRHDNGTGILANMTNGGEGSGGHICSDEFKQKLRQLYKNRIFSEDHRKNLSKARKGRISWNKGVKHTPKTIEKIRQGKLGNKNPNYNKAPSEEARRKNSEAHKGEKNHFYGKQHTEEAKKKIKESWVRRKLKNKPVRVPYKD